MNETQIATDLAKSVPVESAPPVVTADSEPTGPSAFDSNVALNDTALVSRIFDFFAVSTVDKYNEETQRQLREVVEWAGKRANSNSVDDILLQLISLQNELGGNFTSFNDRLQRVAKFVTLQRQAEVLRAQMGALYG